MSKGNNNAKGKLQQGEGTLRTMAEDIVDTVRESLLVLDKEMRVVRANRSFYNIFQLNPEEVEGRLLYELGAGEWNIPQLRQLLEEILPKQKSVEAFEVTQPFTRIGTRTMLLNARELRQRPGMPPMILLAIEDISQHKNAEEALKQAEALYHSLVDSLDQWMFRKDRYGRFTYANPRFCQLLGQPLENILGKTDFDFFPAEWATKYRQDDLRVMETGETLSTVERHRTPAGVEMFVQVVKTPLRDATGNVMGIQGIFWDVTEAKKAEEQLRQQAMLLDAAADAIVVINLHTGANVDYLNQSAERLFGRTKAEVVGRPFKELFTAEPAALDAAIAAVIEDGRWNGELKLSNKDGAERAFFCRWNLLSDEANKPWKILGIYTDVTDKKQLEAQLARAQRMETIGALAGGIAHDLNNILTPIMMMGPLLRMNIKDADSLKLIETVESCAKRGADIIKQLLVFARGKPGARVPLPPRHLLRELEKLIRETFPRQIGIRVEAPDGLWPLLGDATQVHQALMNLCINARDAMPEGGQLTLSAANVTVGTITARLPLNAKPGFYVRLSVSDTGTGIAPQHMERIFDPFFTTKEVGRGTGLGLSMVLGIMRGHDGFINVQSAPGKGATFELYFPAAPEARAESIIAPAGRPPRGKNQCVLVVDDEHAVLAIARQMLEEHGYKVFTAANGEEALKIFAAHGSEIQAVITDMMMPSMDGPTLVKTLRRKAPGLLILGMTGLTEADEAGWGEGLQLAAILKKPFSSETILWALHNGLSGARA